jgi:hypothetical protein
MVSQKARQPQNPRHVDAKASLVQFSSRTYISALVCGIIRVIKRIEFMG